MMRFTVIHFDSLPSSNIHAHELIRNNQIEEDTVVWTDYQEIGKGQRGRSWHSEPAKNLLFSIYLKTNLNVQDVFLLNKLIALTVYELLDNLSVENLSLKWPNDILVGRKKIGGILIENGIQGHIVNQSIVGIGLNINQQLFPNFNREATSLSLIKGEELDREEILKDFLALLDSRLSELTLEKQKIERNYIERLYGMGKSMGFQLEDESFNATVAGVDENGFLILEREGKQFKYAEREIRFID